MKNLLYKDLRLAIVPFFYLLPTLTGALMLVPGWLYFVVFMYFSFITVPNAFAVYRAQNDPVFSIMLPVRKKDMVHARIMTFVLLELLHISFGAIYAMIHLNIYEGNRFIFLSPNLGFFGLVFVMYGLFNLVLFPMFYKTGYKYGVPLLTASAVILIYATGVEYLGLKNTWFHGIMKGLQADVLVPQVALLGGGILVFIITGILAVQLSRKNYEKVDIG